MPELKTRLVLEKRDFTTPAEGARVEMEKLKSAVGQVNAELVVNQREARAAGGGTELQIAKIKELKTELKSLQTELRTTKTDYKALSEAAPIPSAMPQASRPSAAVRVAEESGEAVTGGLTRTGKMELGHIGRSIGGTVLAGGSVGRGVEMELPRIASLLGEMGLGLSTLLPALAALAPVVAATAAGFSAYSTNKEANATRRDLRKIGENFTNLGDDYSDRDNPNRGFHELRRRYDERNRLDALRLKLPDGEGLPTENTESSSDLEKKEQDATAAIKEARHKRHSKSNRFWNNFGLGAGDQEINEATGRRNEIRDQRDGNQSRDQNFARRAFEGDPEVEADKLRVTLAERLSQIAAETATGKMKDGEKQAALAHESFNLAVDELRQRQALQKIAVDAEEKIVGIKQKGYQVDLQIAQVRLDAANAALRTGPQQGDAHDKLQAAVNAAQLQVDLASKETVERQEQYALEKRIAELRGSSNQVREATLKMDRDDIERRLKGAKPDEKEGILVEQSRNQQQQDEFNKDKGVRDIDTAEKEDRAQSGRGLASQIELLGKEILRNAQRRDWNTNENGGDRDFAAGLDERAKDLRETIEDVIFAEQQRLQSLRNADAEIKGRGLEATLAMKNRKVDMDADARIAEERHGKNDPAVVAQMNRNRADEEFENAIDEEQMSPAQKRARAKKNFDRQQAAARVEARQRHHAQTTQANSTDRSFEAFFGDHNMGPNHQIVPVLPKQEVSAASMAHTAAAKGGFKGDLATVESLLSQIRENCDYKLR